MNDCLFCKIIKGDIKAEKVYEDEYTFAFLDINPINEGHTLVVPKKHSKNLYEISDEALKYLTLTTKKLSIAIKKAIEAQGINIGINNDSAAGQVIFHTHIHIMPRFEDDGFKLWKGTPYKNENMEKIAEIIRREI